MVNTKIFQPVPNNVKQITLVGRAKDPGGIFKIVVNDQEAPFSAAGDFKAVVDLRVGDNDIFVEATDLSRNSLTMSYFIFREDTVITEMASLVEGGKYYALIIGVSNYTDPQITDLDGYPVQDAERLAQILTTNYTFDKEHTILLLNAGRANIQRAFDDLSKMITDKDNLLIFLPVMAITMRRPSLGTGFLPMRKRTIPPTGYTMMCL